MKNLDKKIKFLFFTAATLVFASPSLVAQSKKAFNPHQIVYATMKDGKQVPVELTIEKASGSANSISNTVSFSPNKNTNVSAPANVNVVAGKNPMPALSSAVGFCDSIQNYNKVSPTSINYSFGGTSGFGYIGGTGPLPVNMFADRFDASTKPTATHIQWFTVRFLNPNATASPNAPPPFASDTGTFKLALWDNSGAAGIPGALPLATIPVNYKTVRDAFIFYNGYVNFKYSFATPIQIPNNDIFYVGTMCGNMTPDTLVMGMDGDTIGNTSWSNISGGWKPIKDDFTWLPPSPNAGKFAHCRAWIRVGLTDEPVTVAATPANDTICMGTAINYTVGGTNAVSYRWSFQGGSITQSTSPTPTVTYNNPGQYFYNIQGFNSCGFVHSLYGIIRVDSLPPVAILGPSFICTGTSTVLSASGADTYIWTGMGSTPTVTVSPVSATNYTLTGTKTATGCSKTVVKTVDNFQDPGASFVNTTIDTLCPDVEIVFDGTSSTHEASYAWTFAPGTGLGSIATPTVTFTTPGTFFIKLVVDNGCGKLDSIDNPIIVPACVFIGIGEQADKKMKSYFNQSNSTLQLTLNKEFKGTFNLAVYNSIGQLITAKTLITNASDSYNIQLPQIDKGVYVVRLSDGKNQYTDSFVH